MNFLQYKNAVDFLEKTGLTPKDGLTIVEREIAKLKAEVGG